MGFVRLISWLAISIMKEIPCTRQDITRNFTRLVFLLEILAERRVSASRVHHIFIAYVTAANIYIKKQVGPTWVFPPARNYVMPMGLFMVTHFS